MTRFMACHPECANDKARGIAAAEQRGIAKGLQMAAHHARRLVNITEFPQYAFAYENVRAWCNKKARAITKRAKEGSK